MQFSVLIPVVSRDLLHGGAHGYGFLLAAQGLGAVNGAIVTAWVDGRRAAAAEADVRKHLYGDRAAGFGLSNWMAFSLARRYSSAPG